MGYNQLMIANGKGKKVDIGKIIKVLTDQKVDRVEKAKPKNVDDLDATPAELSEPEDIATFERRQLHARKKVQESKL